MKPTLWFLTLIVTLTACAPVDYLAAALDASREDAPLALDTSSTTDHMVPFADALPREEGDATPLPADTAIEAAAPPDVPVDSVPDAGEAVDSEEVADAPSDVAADVASEPACGAAGQACCPGRVCGSGLGCSAALLCGGCGGRGQPCCWSGPGALCGSGFTCRGSGLSATCECGNPGEECCGGLVCNVVPGRANSCQVVGARRTCG